jgi:hypothetical protein
LKSKVERTETPTRVRVSNLDIPRKVERVHVCKDVHRSNKYNPEVTRVEE